MSDFGFVGVISTDIDYPVILRSYLDTPYSFLICVKCIAFLALFRRYRRMSGGGLCSLGSRAAYYQMPISWKFC